MKLAKHKLRGIKLWHKGLIMVSVPLFCELAFVLTLIGLVHQADLDVQREYHAKLTLLKVSDLSKEFSATAQLLFVQAFSRGSDTDMLFNMSIERLQKKLEAIRASRTNDLFEREIFRKLNILSEEEIQLLVSVKLWLANPNDGLYMEKGDQLRERARSLLAEMTKQLNKLDEYESKIEKESPEKSHASRRNVELFLLFGVLANIVGAVYISQLFTRRIASRIDSVATNCINLAEGQALLPPISGDDEIGVVDHTFHDMADALAEAMRKEHSLLDNALDIICSLNESAEFLQINPACLGSWLYEPSELIGKNVADFVFDENEESILDKMRKCRQDPAAGIFELRIKRKDDSIAFTSWICSWSARDQALFCVVHDITARKRMEELKQQFVDMVTHDLRTPLSAIKTILALILDGRLGEVSEKVMQRLSSVDRNCTRLISLINDLLDIEKLESGKMDLDRRQMPLNRVLATCHDTLERLAESNGVKLRFEPVEFYVLADEQRVVQVLINLISNAIKYAPQDSEILLSCREITVPADSSHQQTSTDDPPHAGGESGAYVEVSVRDSGRGVPAQLQTAIFERFRQVEVADATKKGGTGLGLAICKAIVEQHGGAIGVRSVEGQGSTFWFTLPEVREDLDSL